MKKLAALLIFSLLFSVSTLLAQLNMTQLGNLTYGPELNDIWGYVDSLGNEYALVGIGNGVSVVDVTNPATPTEVYFIPGPSSTWRDLKVWNKHAYITNETSGGLMIIDLSNLPNPVFPTVVSYSGSTYPFTSAHDLYIDENGVAYIMGADNGNGGAIMLDLTIDPQAPVELGRFNTYYLHDGMVRGDTLWGAAINAGLFVVVDVSNKSAPSVMATQNSPGNFTHNCWISDDGDYLFTTDEISNAFIGSYDVSNLGNITFQDQVQSNPGSNVIVHNTYVINNFIVSSYYRDGVTIHDITRPHNMIEVGNFDTSPLSGNGYNGAWGVYPWLPSGNVIVSDIENGLFVLGATYVQGCYLEGTVTDSITTLPINNATIQILTTSATTTSDVSGDYATAVLTPGTYNVVFSAPGYTSDTLSAILANGVLTILDAVLLSPTPFTVTGQVIEATMGAPIPGANVIITNSDFTYNVTTDGSGNFSITPFYAGTYEIIGGKWLFKSTCFIQYIDSTTASGVIELDSGIYDDFTFDYGWTVNGSAVTGAWEKGEPVGTTYGGGDANPDFDVTTDCFEEAYITGNAGGGVGNDDVDDGNTILTSPVFDLSSFTEPYVNYYRWFFNDGGSGTPNDELEVRLYNGTSTVIIETVTEASAGNGTWVPRSIKVSDFITPSSTMQLIFETSDLSGSGHLVEAGVDQFEVGDYGLSITLSNASCFGTCDGQGTATVVGGQLPFTYFWDDPGTQSNATATGLCAGFYNILVIDAAGDSALGSVSINQPNQISLSTSTAPTCTSNVSDASVTALAGVTPYTYLWDSSAGGQTTQTATGLNVGTYLVTVTDNNGCSNSTSVSIGANFVISVSATGTNPTTCGGSDGSAAATAVNGNSPYTYLWDDSGAQTNATAGGLSAGTYKVIATDNDGCSDSTTVVLTDAGAASLVISDSTMVSCIGPNSGSATVGMTGGAAPYTYTWNTTPTQTDSTATGLAVGSYNVTVSDNNGCSSSTTVSITAILDISVVATSTNPSACGAADGSATAAATDGLPPYTYLWSDGGAQTNANATGLLSGNYNVTVADLNGCIDSATVSVNDPGAPSLTISATTMPSCFGGNDGTGTVAASGGATPYTYAWGTTPIQNDSMGTGLSAGTYNISVTDAGSCTSSTTVNISEPSAVVVVISASDISCFGANDGAASVSVNGGTTPYSYMWDTGDSTVPLINLSAGSYILTVTDANSCTSVDSASITEPVEMTISTTITDATSGLCNGIVAVGVLGGIPPFTYLWDDPDTQATVFATGLCAGSYIVVVTDSAGCTQTAASVVQLLDVISVKNSVESRLKVYPNPNSGSFIIDLILKDPGEVRFELINTIGQIVYAEKLSTSRAYMLNLPNASAGIYQLRIITSTEIFQKKVIIAR